MAATYTIANSIKPAANPVQAAIETAPTPPLTTATVNPLFTTPQTLAVSSVKLPETVTQPQFLATSGMGNLTNPNTMTIGNVNPLGLSNTTVGAVDPFAQLQKSPVAIG